MTMIQPRFQGIIRAKAEQGVYDRYTAGHPSSNISQHEVERKAAAVDQAVFSKLGKVKETDVVATVPERITLHSNKATMGLMDTYYERLPFIQTVKPEAIRLTNDDARNFWEQNYGLGLEYEAFADATTAYGRAQQEYDDRVEQVMAPELEQLNAEVAVLRDDRMTELTQDLKAPSWYNKPAKKRAHAQAMREAKRDASDAAKAMFETRKADILKRDLELPSLKAALDVVEQAYQVEALRFEDLTRPLLQRGDEFRENVVRYYKENRTHGAQPYSEEREVRTLGQGWNQRLE